MDGPKLVVALLATVAAAAFTDLPASQPSLRASSRLSNIWIPNVRDTYITGQSSPSVSIPSNYNVGKNED